MSNETTDGEWETFTADGDLGPVLCYGDFHVHVSGNLDGGDVQVKITDPGGTERNMANANYDAAVDDLIAMPRGARSLVTLSLANSGSPSVVLGLRGERR